MKFSGDKHCCYSNLHANFHGEISWLMKIIAKIKKKFENLVLTKPVSRFSWNFFHRYSRQIPSAERSLEYFWQPEKEIQHFSEK